MRLAWTSALALIGLSLIVGHAQAEPDPVAQADSLLSQAKAASGGAAWDRIQGWHERGAIAGAKGEITYDAWIDVREPAMLTRTTSAGRSLSQGFDGRIDWSIDRNGVRNTDLSAEAAAKARQDSYFAMYGFFFPDRLPAQRAFIGSHAGNGAVFDVVRVKPADGTAEDLWIDHNTHLLAAVVNVDKAHPMTTFLGDFKVVDGVTLPFTVQQGADAAHQMTRHISAYTFDAIEPSRFAPPLR